MNHEGTPAGERFLPRQDDIVPHLSGHHSVASVLPVRVLLTGSRDWTGVYGSARIHTVLNVVLALAEVLGQKLTIVHGDGPGADQVIDAWAVRREDSGVTVERHPAPWVTMGRKAGPLRNRDMISLGADMCIGFLKDASRGTTGTLVLAREAGIPTYTVHWEQEVT